MLPIASGYKNVGFHILVQTFGGTFCLQVYDTRRVVPQEGAKVCVELAASIVLSIF